MANIDNEDRGFAAMNDEQQREMNEGGNGESGARKRSERGFAAMSPEQQREIASKGGKAAHAKGTAHEFTSEEARAAGRKGGETVSTDREHMSQIGRKGGESRGKRSQ